MKLLWLCRGRGGHKMLMGIFEHEGELFINHEWTDSALLFARRCRNNLELLQKEQEYEFKHCRGLPEWASIPENFREELVAREALNRL